RRLLPDLAASFVYVARLTHLPATEKPNIDGPQPEIAKGRQRIYSEALHTERVEWLKDQLPPLHKQIFEESISRKEAAAWLHAPLARFQAQLSNTAWEDGMRLRLFLPLAGEEFLVGE